MRNTPYYALELCDTVLRVDEKLYPFVHAVSFNDHGCELLASCTVEPEQTLDDALRPLRGARRVHIELHRAWPRNSAADRVFDQEVELVSEKFEVSYHRLNLSDTGHSLMPKGTWSCRFTYAVKQSRSEKPVPTLAASHGQME